MTDDTRVPHMTDAQSGHVFQHLGRQVVHFARPVVLQRPVLLAVLVAIAVEARKNLIDDYLLHLHLFFTVHFSLFTFHSIP